MDPTNRVIVGCRADPGPQAAVDIELSYLASVLWNQCQLAVAVGSVPAILDMNYRKCCVTGNWRRNCVERAFVYLMICDFRMDSGDG